MRWAAVTAGAKRMPRVSLFTGLSPPVSHWTIHAEAEDIIVFPDSPNDDRPTVWRRNVDFDRRSLWHSKQKTADNQSWKDKVTYVGIRKSRSRWIYFVHEIKRKSCTRLDTCAEWTIVEFGNSDMLRIVSVLGCHRQTEICFAWTAFPLTETVLSDIGFIGVLVFFLYLCPCIFFLTLCFNVVSCNVLGFIHVLFRATVSAVCHIAASVYCMLAASHLAN